MRKQYHFQQSERGVLAWDVDRLIERAKGLPRIRVPLSGIGELDEPFWFSGGSAAATCRAIVEHARLINEADLNFPILLSFEGRVMDGMHRVAKAALLGHTVIQAVQFPVPIEPDFVGLGPDELPGEEHLGGRRKGL